MARNNSMLPLPTRGGPGRLIAGLVVVALVALALRDPIGSAEAVRSIFAGLGHAVDSLGVFAQQFKR